MDCKIVLLHKKRALYRHNKLIKETMKTCGEVRDDKHMMMMPGVTVKSRGIDQSTLIMDQLISKANGANARNVLPQPPIQQPKEIMNTSPPQSYKGFYTWLSSPKTIYNHRKMNNVAIIAPTQHHT